MVAKLEPPATGERTVWCPFLACFGVRIRAGGSRTFIVKYRTKDGKQRKMTLGSSPALKVDDARRIAKQHLGDVERGRDPASEHQVERAAPTMADLAERYLAMKRDVKRPSSLRNDEDMFRDIVLPVLGKKRIQAVTSADIESLHRSRKDTPYRANRVLALLSHAFRHAVRWGWRSDNPVSGVQRFHEDRRERWLQGDDLSRLLAVLEEHPNQRAAQAIMLMLLTGCRKGEALAAHWNQFDLDAQVWTMPSHHTKQKKLNRVPLNHAAVKLLAGLKAAREVGTPSPYVFPGDVPGKPLQDIKGAWRSICKAAGLSDVRLHDLRHTYASHLASNGTNLNVVGRLLGHTQAATTMRYAHLADNPLREATAVMGKLVEGASGRPRGVGSSTAKNVPVEHTIT
jgi:integrase